MAFTCSEVLVNTKPSINSNYFLYTAIVQIVDLMGQTRLVRALIDPGAQTSLVASTAISNLNVKEELLEIPMRISGLHPELDYVTNHDAFLTLTHRSNPNFSTYQRFTVMDCSGWNYRPPYPVSEWMKNMAPCLSDPNAVLGNGDPLPFHLILNIGCTIDVLDPYPIKKLYNCEVRGSLFGNVIAGENPRINSELPIDKSQVIDCTNTVYVGAVTGTKTKRIKKKQGELTESKKNQYSLTPPSLSSESVEEVNSMDVELTQEINDMVQLLKHMYFGDDSLKEETEQDVLDLESSFQRAEDGRLWVILPKNTRCQKPLSKNERLNRARINGTKVRCQRDQAFYQGYKESFDAWKQTGVITPVTRVELDTIPNWTELPYHGVLRKGDSKFLTTKFRLVLDGSAKEEGYSSVNEYLRTGSNVLPKIIKVITQFRQMPYFTVADIEKAFLQIGLLFPDDHLFIFRAIVQKSDGSWDEELYRFTRMPWGINCAPYVLNVAIRYLYSEYCKENQGNQEIQEMFRKLSETTYVDDILSLSETLEGLKDTSQRMVKSLEQGRMHVTKIRTFPPHFVSEIFEGLEATEESYKILGLRFHPKSDEVTVSCDKLKELLTVELFTKRKAAGVGARVHDTQGFVEPTTMRAKELFQRTNYQYPTLQDWPVVINKTLVAEWKQLIQDLLEVDTIKFPRCVTPMETIKKTLVLFTDASALAIGACIYVISTLPNGSKVARLARSQSQIVPLKRQQSLKLEREKQQKCALRINRLELQAIELGARLVKVYIEDSFGQYESIYAFTDSEVSLHWLHSDFKHHTKYVQSRVEVALGIIPKDKWYHIKGIENPADLLSRGCTVKELSENQIWKSGPAWLINEPQTWRPFKEQVSELVHNQTIQEINSPKERTWKELILQAWVELKDSEPESNYEDAEFSVIKAIQIKELPELYLFLSGKKSAGATPVKFRTMIDELGLFLDEKGIIWSKSRNAVFHHLNKDSILPIDKDLVLFPNTGPEAVLLLNWIHEFETNHGTPNVALALLRSKFWMPKARGLFKKIRKKCKVCQVLQATAMKQIEAPLPKERYTISITKGQRPFDCCGIDYVGPFYPFRSKESKPKLKENLKRYQIQRNLLVFTCALTRAVHIEPCPTTGFEDFVSAFESFCARFSKPRLIYSDNAQTFHQSKTLLSTFEVDTSNKLKSKFPEITWKFNASRAPWWGGFYERMMGMIKLHLALLFKERDFNTELAFRSTIEVIQNIINSRPLVQASEDDRSDSTFITPNHFIKMNPETELFRSFHFDLEKIRVRSLTGREMKKRLQDIRQFHQQLWDDFIIRYLAELRKFHANRSPNSLEDVSKLKVGDIVLVQPESSFKNSKHFKLEWPKARVTSIPVGPDTRYRKVFIETIPNGIKLERTIQKLCRLECEDSSDQASA